MNDNIVKPYPYWSCMGCCALNSADYATCFRCNMTMEDSDMLYKQELNRRADPRPRKLAEEQREAQRTFDALPRAPEYHEPYKPSHAELLHKLRISRLRRHLWVAVKAFWQGVFSALVFIGWCILVAFFVMGVVSLFIH